LSAAVAFALASLLCAGVTDVVHKRYSTRDRSRGLYVLGIGIAWTVMQVVVVAMSGRALRMDAATLAFGLAAGTIVASANTLLIESLTHVDVGLGSTIYRLNTIAVVVMAVVLLGEPLTGVKATGILLGIAAVFLLFEREHSHEEARARFVLFFGLAVLASLLRASFGILSKVAVASGVDPAEMLLVNAPVWIAVGAVYARARGERIAVDRATLGYGIASGALICGVANFLLLALEGGEASVVVPIANMSFLVALLISAALGMERFTARKAAAVALAVLAIVVLSRA
jgi:drug/metabolite transporter (DMT)-like permease